MYEQFVGIDISKDNFDVVLLESSGEIKLEKKLTMDRDGFNTLLEYFIILFQRRAFSCNGNYRYLPFTAIIFFT